MVETPIGFQRASCLRSGYCTGAGRILDRATHRAKLALDLQFPHTIEHQAGPASTTLGIYMRSRARKTC